MVAAIRITLAAFCVLMGIQGVQGANHTSRPNIVLVVIDDAGFSDFASYGGEIDTPNIDALAQGGTRFTSFHAAPTCEASRMMLHSGVDNHLAGGGTLMPLIADNQRGKPGYEGYLNDNVYSLGQLMQDAGYATYFAGKWNAGSGLARSPGARGWSRYLGLEQTGADNYEARVWAPFNAEAIWWQDGQRYYPPRDFYSSRTYVDTLIRYIDEGRIQSEPPKPFMAMLAFQAVHSPLQAPEQKIAKYTERYQSGWERIREARYQRQIELGIMPAGLVLPELPAQLGLPHMQKGGDWDALPDDERSAWARKMAAFAGMLDEADEQIGRLREHLAATGQLENTVFIVLSDNGGDGLDMSNANLPFKFWYHLNFKLAGDDIGGPGSYVHYGPYWAQVSNTPLALMKATPGEGGMRVPLVIQLPESLQGDAVPPAISPAFVHVTDILPTLLQLAGAAKPGDEYRGRKMHVPTGRSLLPLLQGASESVHPDNKVTGFEGMGGEALYRGNFKLTRMGAPLDGRWRLFDIVADPVESNDLSAEYPQRMAQMLEEVEHYRKINGVVLAESGYDPLRQVLINNLPVLLRQIAPALLLMMFFAGLFGLFIWQQWSRVRSMRRDGPW